MNLSALFYGLTIFFTVAYTILYFLSKFGVFSFEDNVELIILNLLLFFSITSAGFLFFYAIKEERNALAVTSLLPIFSLGAHMIVPSVTKTFGIFSLKDFLLMLAIASSVVCGVFFLEKKYPEKENKENFNKYYANEEDLKEEEKTPKKETPKKVSTFKMAIIKKIAQVITLGSIGGLIILNRTVDHSDFVDKILYNTAIFLAIISNLVYFGLAILDENDNGKELDIFLFGAIHIGILIFFISSFNKLIPFIAAVIAGSASFLSIFSGQLRKIA